MGISLPQDRKKKALVGAIAAAIVAGILTMFIPTSVLESITGATGLSELVPATAAPLGDKARALIAFGVGALTLATMAIFLLRKDNTDVTKYDSVEKPETKNENAKTGSEKLSLAGKLIGLKDNLPKISLPKMPWVKGENEVRDLSDLPSVRSADAHPDAPVRQPLLATKDLPSGVKATEGMTAMSAPAQQEAEISKEQPAEEAVPLLQVEPAAEIATPAAPVDDAPRAENLADVETASAAETDEEIAPPEPPKEPSLPDMVAKLEASLGRRRQQHSQLAQATEQSAEPAVSETLPPKTSVPVQSEPSRKPAVNPLADPFAEIDDQPELKCPPLEAVPDNKDEPIEEMDGALNAALETLHRMNAQAR